MKEVTAYQVIWRIGDKGIYNKQVVTIVDFIGGWVLFTTDNMEAGVPYIAGRTDRLLPLPTN